MANPTSPPEAHADSRSGIAAAGQLGPAAGWEAGDAPLAAGMAGTPLSQTLQEIQARIHAKLYRRTAPLVLEGLPDKQRRQMLRQVFEEMIDAENVALHHVDRLHLVEHLLDEAVGLGPLQGLVRDPGITDILVNGPNEVWIERHGKLHKTDVQFADVHELMRVIHHVVAKVGRHVDAASPMVDARLPDGSRINVIIPPVSVRGPMLSIRRFGTIALKLKHLLRLKSLAPEMAVFLEAAVKARLNILISGGAGSGKTTLLNVLSGFIPLDQRLVTIEDVTELQLQQPHVVQLEARPANIEGRGVITMRDLLRNALRMRPDRIIVNECRGAEVLEMLQAMNTGHTGSLSTIHANSARDALMRLEMMIVMAGLELPLRAMRQQIATALNLIIHLDRVQGGARRVTAVSELLGRKKGAYVLRPIFRYEQGGIAAKGNAYGRFVATGMRPRFLERLKAAGVDLPADLFDARPLLEA